jgi:hypothetical protein
MIGRLILSAIIFYFVYRFLDALFRPKRQPAAAQPRQKVTVQYDPNKAKSKVADDVGEYVEYEEIKDGDR